MRGTYWSEGCRHWWRGVPVRVGGEPDVSAWPTGGVVVTGLDQSSVRVDHVGRHVLPDHQATSIMVAIPRLEHCSDRPVTPRGRPGYQAGTPDEGHPTTPHRPDDHRLTDHPSTTTTEERDHA